MTNLSKTKPIQTLLLLIPTIVLSWIFVHVFAVLGIFLAVAYPIWWLIFPKLTPCIFCRTTPIGEKCRACHDVVTIDKRYPTNFASIARNFLLIMLISGISVLTVYGETLVLNKLGIRLNDASVEFIIPDKQQYKIGEIFPIELNINSNGVNINAVQTDIAFNPNKVEVVKLSLEESFAQIFIQKEINNDDGYLRVTGGLPSPGYKGDNGHFATVYFQSKEAGIFEIQFLPSSLVLENDGNGTNVLKSYPKTSYLIKPEYVSETEKELQSTILSLNGNNVLGVDSTNNQMLFFDTKDNSENIMGVEDINSSASKVEAQPKKTFWEILLTIDRWIVELFTKLFKLL
jgi:hypothetical protein